MVGFQFKLLELKNEKEGQTFSSMCLIQHIFELRKVDVKVNSEIKRQAPLVCILVGDPTQSFMKISLWDEKTLIISKRGNQLQIGDLVYLQGFRIKRYKGNVEGSSTRDSIIRRVWTDNRLNPNWGFTFSDIRPLVTWALEQFPNILGRTQKESSNVVYQDFSQLSDNQMLHTIALIQQGSSNRIQAQPTKEEGFSFILYDALGNGILLNKVRNVSDELWKKLQKTAQVYINIRFVMVRWIQRLNRFELFYTQCTTITLLDDHDPCRKMFDERKIQNRTTPTTPTPTTTPTTTWMTTRLTPSSSRVVRQCDSFKDIFSSNVSEMVSVLATIESLTLSLKELEQILTDEAGKLVDRICSHCETLLALPGKKESCLHRCSSTDDCNATAVSRYKTIQLTLSDCNGDFLKVEMRDSVAVESFSFITADMILFPEKYTDHLKFHPRQQLYFILQSLLVDKNAPFPMEIYCSRTQNVIDHSNNEKFLLQTLFC